jgi:hypothetical protein
MKNDEIIGKLINILEENLENIKYNFNHNSNDPIMSAPYIKNGNRSEIRIFNLVFSLNGLEIYIEKYESMILCKIYINGYRKIYEIRNHWETNIYNICDKLVTSYIRKSNEEVLEDLAIWERNNTINKIVD